MSTQCDNCEKITVGFANMGRGAPGAEGWDLGRGVPLSNMGGAWGRGFLRKFFNFLAQNIALWHLF